MMGVCRVITILVCSLTTAAFASSGGSYSPLAFLLDLGGSDTVGVRYAPGTLDRAVHLQQRFELVVSSCRSWANHSLPLVIYVLGREEWQAAGLERPYGLPQAMSASELALASWGDAETVELWKGLLGRRLPGIPGTALRGSPEEVASMALHDQVGLVEGFEMCLAESGISADQPWGLRVLVQVMVRSFLQKNEAGRLAEFDRTFADLSEQAGGLGAHSLAVATAPQSVAEWLWAEAQFHEAARLIEDEEGKAAAKAVAKLATKNDGRLLTADLLSRYPGLATWLTEAFRDQPAAR
jgi:hypothetical protein